MNGQRFRQVYTRLLELTTRERRPREQYSDLMIVATFLWAVLHNRPQGWGCRLENWTCEPPGDLPSQSRLSRRLRTPPVQDLLKEAARHVWGPGRAGLLKFIDGKPLPVSFSSTDRTAKIGQISGRHKAKGYKLHLIVDAAGRAVAWAATPLSANEAVVARGLVRHLPGAGYLVGDAGYEGSPLALAAACHGHQLVAPPQRPGEGLGHRRHSRYRLRCLELVNGAFGRALLAGRRCVMERVFGNLGWSGALGPLPGFVRTIGRVSRWVDAKMLLRGVQVAEKLDLQQ